MLRVVERSWELHPEVLRSEGNLLVYLFFQKLLEEVFEGIGFHFVAGKSVIVGEVEDGCSEFFGHEEALHEGIHVACVAHIFESSISIADFSFLPDFFLF